MILINHTYLKTTKRIVFTEKTLYDSKLKKVTQIRIAHTRKKTKEEYNLHNNNSSLELNMCICNSQKGSSLSNLGMLRKRWQDWQLYNRNYSVNIVNRLKNLVLQ